MASSDISSPAVELLDRANVHFFTGINMRVQTLHYMMPSSTAPSAHMKSFMVSARDLFISWSERPDYWRWLWLEDDVNVEVAEMLRVCWLEIRGSFPMEKLEKGMRYKVSFVVMVKNPSGLEPEAKFKLEVPGMVVEKQLKLQELKPKTWVEVEIGRFNAAKDGQIKFSMTDYDKLNWKEGLIVVGVVIQTV